MHFICSIDTFKALNNRISNQNLSETAQNPVRFFETNILARSMKAVPGYMRKKIENFVYSPSRVTSKSVGKRICNVLSFDNVRSAVEIVDIRSDS